MTVRTAGRLIWRAVGDFEAGHAGHFDIGDEDIGGVLLDGAQGVAAVGGAGDDLDVGLELEQGGEGAEDHGLIFGEHDADLQRACSRMRKAERGSSMTRRVPGLLHAAGIDVKASAELLDALAHAAESVAFAGADSAALPLSWTSSAVKPSGVVVKRMVHWVAWAWRTMLVTASRTASESTVSSRALQGGRAGLAGEGDAGGSEGEARLLDFGGEALAAIAADGFAHFGERGAGGAFDVGDLGGGAGGFIGVPRR